MIVRSPRLPATRDALGALLIDASPDATLLIDDAGHVVFVNERARDVLGVGTTGVVDIPLAELLPDVAVIVAGERRRTASDASVAGASVAGASVAGDGLLVRTGRDGTGPLVELRLTHVRFDDRDLTMATMRTTGAQFEDVPRLRSIVRALDASDDGIFILDVSTASLVFVNDGAVRLTGFPREELLTMPPSAICGEWADHEELHELGHHLGTGRSVSSTAEGELVRKDGTTVEVEFTSQSTSTEDGARTVVVSLVRNISERVRRDAALYESKRALREVETTIAIAHDRERIARDLHDTVIQQLFGEGLSLQSILPLVDPLPAERIRSAIDGLDESIKRLRTAIFSLQGTLAAPGGLRGRVISAVSDSVGSLGFEPRVQFDGAVETIDSEIAEELIHVLRDALGNVAQRTGAGAARVAVDATNDIVLTVADDGLGVADRLFGGRGLDTIQARAHELGGQCTITNRRTGGAILVWRVPSHDARSRLGPTGDTVTDRDGHRSGLLDPEQLSQLDHPQHF